MSAGEPTLPPIGFTIDTNSTLEKINVSIKVTAVDSNKPIDLNKVGDTNIKYYNPLRQGKKDTSIGDADKNEIKSALNSDSESVTVDCGSSQDALENTGSNVKIKNKVDIEAIDKIKNCQKSFSENHTRLKKPVLGNNYEKIGKWTSDCKWLRISHDRETYIVSARDIYDSSKKEHLLTISKEFIAGTCHCCHYIDGTISQLLPCRGFLEVFLRGDWDRDWDYLMRGLIFGFKAINQNYDAVYDGSNYSSIRLGEHYKIMNKKLLKEPELGVISVTKDKPACIHGIFCIPKGGGIRGIVDCSKPVGYCVNNYTNKVAMHFSYNSLDKLMENVCMSDSINTVDISDAYRAVNIHPSDRCHQG